MPNAPIVPAAPPPAPPPPPRGIPDTDDDRAARFVEWLEGDYRYLYPWKQWAHWNGDGWTLDPTGRHESLITMEAREFGRDLMEQAIALPLGPQQIAATAAARRALSADHLFATIKLAKSEPDIRISPTDFDADPWMLGVQNGVIDLRTGAFREVQKEDLILKKCGISFEPDAKCPMWEEFLEQILPDAEVRTFMQRAVGYALTGKTTEQCLFFLYGMGQNGKSTFIETVEHIFGNYAWRTSAELFLDGKASDNKMNMLASLPEMRFVVGAEMPDGAHLAENRIKDLTGGDRIQARKLYCEAFNYYPTHKLFFYGNHRPGVRGTDKGIWRRLNVIPFTVEVPDAKRDMKIVARLRSECHGILNWAIAGCLEWQNGGLRAPDAVKLATEEYREEEDLIGEFIEAECERRGEISRQSLARNFADWAKSGGYKFSPSPRAVTDRVRRLSGISSKIVHGVRVWVGLSMKDPAAFRNK